MACLESSAVHGDAGPSFVASVLRPFLIGLRELGVDPAVVCERAGLGRLADVEGSDRVSFETAIRFLNCAIKETGRSALGLELAQRHQVGGTGVLEVLCVNSPTVGDALAYVARYEGLLQDIFTTELTVREPGAFIVQRYRPGLVVPRCVSENMLGNLVVFARKLAGSSIPLRSVWFAQPRPGDTRPHDELFRCPVLWGAAVDRVEFDASVLDWPLFHADRELAASLDHHLRRQRLHAAPTMSERVRADILDHVGTGEGVQLATVARRLAVSRRSLQRQLAKENHTFNQLVASVRCGLAKEYLNDPDATVDEIADALGFHEANSFCRAFRQWTGTSPRSFRRR